MTDNCEHKTPHVYQAISDVQREICAIGVERSRHGPGFQFRGTDDAYSQVASLYPKYGLICIPKFTNKKSVFEGRVESVTLDCEFTFISTKDGSSITVFTVGSCSMGQGKATNGAMSTGHAYAIWTTFHVPGAPVVEMNYESSAGDCLPSAKPVERQQTTDYSRKSANAVLPPVNEKIRNEFGSSATVKEETPEPTDSDRQTFRILQQRVAAATEPDEIKQIIDENKVFLDGLKKFKTTTYDSFMEQARGTFLRLKQTAMT